MYVYIYIYVYILYTYIYSNKKILISAFFNNIFIWHTLFNTFVTYIFISRRKYIPKEPL